MDGVSGYMLATLDMKAQAPVDVHPNPDMPNTFPFPQSNNRPVFWFWNLQPIPRTHLLLDPPDLVGFIPVGRMVGQIHGQKGFADIPNQPPTIEPRLVPSGVNIRDAKKTPDAFKPILGTVCVYIFR